jgi:hypothetical protein
MSSPRSSIARRVPPSDWLAPHREKFLRNLADQDCASARHNPEDGIRHLGLNRFAVVSCGKLWCDRSLLHSS